MSDVTPEVSIARLPTLLPPWWRESWASSQLGPAFLRLPLFATADIKTADVCSCSWPQGSFPAHSFLPQLSGGMRPIHPTVRCTCVCFPPLWSQQECCAHPDAHMVQAGAASSLYAALTTNHVVVFHESRFPLLSTPFCLLSAPERPPPASTS